MHGKIFCRWSCASHNLYIPARGRFLGHQCNQAWPRPLMIPICRLFHKISEKQKDQLNVIAGVRGMCHARLPGSSTPSDRVRPRIARSRARTLSQMPTTTTIGLLLTQPSQPCSDHLRFRLSGRSFEVSQLKSLIMSLQLFRLHQHLLHWSAPLISLLPIFSPKQSCKI